MIDLFAVWAVRTLQVVLALRIAIGPFPDLDPFDDEVVPGLGAPGAFGDLERQDFTVFAPELEDVLPLTGASAGRLLRVGEIDVAPAVVA